MTKIYKLPVVPAVPPGGYVVVTQPDTVEPAFSRFAKVLSTNLGGGGGSGPIAFGIDFSQGAVVANGVITVLKHLPYPVLITSLDYEVGAAGGSFTVAVKIAGVNVAGLSAVTVSSATTANTVATGSNTASTGQAITVVISGVAGAPTGANLQINATK